MRMNKVVVWVATLALFLLPNLTGWSAQDMFIVIDDEASVKSLIPNLTNGNGTVALEKKDVYQEDDDRKASLFVDAVGGDFQKFNPSIPDWQISIKKNPGKSEFRYLTWAWKKTGGAGIQLQLSVSGDWGHRYHAGVNAQNWNPSLEVDPKMPKEWTLVTRDVATDWGEIVITGMAFSNSGPTSSVWDHLVFHQTKDDPLAPQAVDPQEKLPVTWGKLKLGD